ncbi:MAG: elongation factor 4 [Candidatus Chisholmbacteria bacterium RIFCSPLOWO2_01_FULL_50_28]|uniref:Elongation factor 4 n=1 Tax=Candidatus Chisholmbacteria bacterium RIFCSPHIGHO2_01_FULL_52_32 TaxID=1797591 RepID=A0A1G1VU44_9BACT|nr:MAG: elongation factor 4 [Candidatus Chisholmbacteria bacterium RIFCSPHIGHO2_01_FULL_52_32]OGY19749.1 MAG: elongation factor 4 [Candidatus Chisholmbacteria bacterium RIFCSPLOWO2_01_FULL_50_28]
MAVHQDHEQGSMRNFAIIAHIDHGKTTLTDRLLEYTKTVAPKEQKERLLDSNPIEKERGITIKLAPVRMSYKLPDNLKEIFNFELCTLNLIDTPGHVDFSYEVSRSLAACEGTILLVDATQGIQAQTLAHAREAMDLGLTLIPTLNKIDLGSARIDEILRELKEVFGIREEEVSHISAKTGDGIDGLLHRLVKEIPPPQGVARGPLRALVFNSNYDEHLGVVAFVRVVDGTIGVSHKVHLSASGEEIEVKEVGVFSPQRTPVVTLYAGEVGYIATGLKDIQALKIGDTITQRLRDKGSIPPALPGFRTPNPVVFVDLFPEGKTTFEELKVAAQKLKLSDASLTLTTIYQPTLGSGLRCGFLGIFHGEITRERLKREQGITTIPTKPTVEYVVEKRNGERIKVHHPSELPDPSEIREIKEPMVEVNIFTPRQYVGPLMQLCEEKRGTYQTTQYFSEQVKIIYRLPFIELVDGFVDETKSRSQGYASLDYQHVGYEPVDAVYLAVLVNYKEVDALSRLVVREKALAVARDLVEKLKELLPRQQFAVPIQASIGGQVIARETKPAARKDVTAKLYGGDQTRKDKLLKKQKKGKKELARIGRVTIPEEVFVKMMKG